MDQILSSNLSLFQIDVLSMARLSISPGKRRRQDSCSWLMWIGALTWNHFRGCHVGRNQSRPINSLAENFGMELIVGKAKRTLYYGCECSAIKSAIPQDDF